MNVLSGQSLGTVDELTLNMSQPKVPIRSPAPLLDVEALPPCLQIFRP
ncbi:hypothetical protein NG271_622 [Saccharomyces cerevisiae synthetic construct]|uniref:Putative uncharacterized protein YDR354C-A n=2 Tax=Saccharomyces cerevisiae TaxID=4932 RepID=YD354_YEAST|nr:RecName: Full=Putative uncharacterized protein YDR354C-A [Saccharomyces cerevisiae S288C]AAL79255.1 unknown [Saccharomyces cerevisiae]WNF20175.1 hypothetical protein NG271_622 [Saccharomyces cerevisiae synthetic construct]CAY78855.1 EC1118_1D0_6469p [Saccharomyces cerevisiae EC1118]